MSDKKKKYLYSLFIVLFFALNILNTFVITTQSLNRYIVPFNHNITSVLNSVIGNFAIMFLFLAIVGLFIKNRKIRLSIMLFMTFFLNFALFGANIYNRYYATSFTMKALSIFQNPSEGFGFTIAFEAFKELITYYRVILFIPTIILGIFYIKLMKENLETLEIKQVTLKSTLTKSLFIILLLFTNLLVFNTKAKQENILDSAKATHATQNIGIYQYIVLDILGYNYISAYNENLEEDYIYETLNNFNKNKDSYKNIFNDKYYSNDLLLKDIENIEGELLNGFGPNDSIKGVLEDYNLVLIHLESFNKFMLEIPEISKHLPNMRHIMSESYVFNNFYTNVGLGNSFDAEVAIMTGLNANGTSTMSWDYYGSKEKEKFQFQTIPKLFKEKNYKTQSIHGNTGQFYNRENFHPDVFGIDKYYGKEEFVRDAGFSQKESEKAIAQFTKDYEHDSGMWVTDRLVYDRMNEQISDKIQAEENFLMYLITMLPHTPYHYDPYHLIPKETDLYTKEFTSRLDKQTLRYINYMKYYDEMFSVLFEKVNGYDDEYIFNKENVYDHKKTAYIFYGDHGSGISKVDLDNMLGEKQSALEARRKLLQTTAFIYVPGELKDNNFREGLLKGEQNLVRGQTDLFRTIIDLFNLPIENSDYIFGVNGMSKEPTFSIDNRTGDVVTDYFIASMRNDFNFIKTEKYDELINKDLIELKEKIILFKIASDHALDNHLYRPFKERNILKLS